MRSPLRLTAASLLLVAAEASLAAPADLVAPADVVYWNGRIYTANASDEIAAALAIRHGRIVFVGSNGDVRRYTGTATRIVDLNGKSAMPGLVDGHLHPLEGGVLLLKCNLNYEALTVPQLQQRIQACLDSTRDQEPGGWLEVVS